MLKIAPKIVFFSILFWMLTNPATAHTDEIDANKTLGIAPLTVQFRVSSPYWNYYELWDFGDGTILKEKNPTYTFTEPGEYTVKVEYRNSTGQYVLQEKKLIAVYSPCGLANLTVLEATTTWEGEDWTNATDGDVKGYDGVVSAMTQNAYAIFKFTDGQKKEIQKIRFRVDYGVQNARNLTKKIRLETSVLEAEDENFQLLKEANVASDGWTEFLFDDIPAKFIKLSLLEPANTLKQFSEIEVYTKFDLVDSTRSSIVATGPQTANGIEKSEVILTLRDKYDSPIIGKTLNDIVLYVSGSDNIVSDFQEEGYGVYLFYLKSFTAESKKIVAYVNGVRVAYTASRTEAITLFSQPEQKSGQFNIVESSSTWPDEGWDKIFDGQESGSHSYVSATGNPPYVTLEFKEQNIQWINKLRIKTSSNTTPEQHNNWVKHFRLLVSTNGLKSSDYTEVLNQDINSGEWEDFYFPASAARYIKLLVDEPKDVSWRQICEIQINVVAAPTPVELAAFEISRASNGVELNWITLSESNNYGFEIQRKSTDGDYEKIDFIEGHGTTSARNAYRFIDNNTSEKEYSYRLKQIDFDGSIAFSEEKRICLIPVDNFLLTQNYPNPFNPETHFQYNVPQSGRVRIVIYNSLGQEINRLIDRHQDAGLYEISWDGTNFSGLPVASGYYLYTIEIANRKESKRMALIR